MTFETDSYARSGDETIRDMLVDLIAQRSKHTDRTRLTLSLNDAVERAALLTANEFAELSLTYLLRYTQHSARNLAAFVEHLNTSVAPFMSDISTEESSYSYLEAQSCAVTSVMSTDLYSIWKQLYGGLFSKGLTNEQILAHLPDGKKGILEGTALVLRCLNDATKFQLNAVNREVFHREAARVALDKNERDNLWNMFEGSMWSKQELIDNLLPRVPTIKRLVELWDTTPLNHLTLTSVGIAIAHANCVRLVGLDADLAIWIK